MAPPAPAVEDAILKLQAKGAEIAATIMDEVAEEEEDEDEVELMEADGEEAVEKESVKTLRKAVAPKAFSRKAPSSPSTVAPTIGKRPAK